MERMRKSQEILQMSRVREQHKNVTLELAEVRLNEKI